MPYTRRRFLKDCTTASFAAAACAAHPVLSYADGTTNPFAPGIRIFFIGTWLFCKDPNSNGLLAITTDFPKGHTFPYGVWPGASGLDCKKCLNPQSTPYQVNVVGTASPAASVQSLFDEASQRCGFTYIKNAKSDLQPNLGNANLLVISFPLPAKLLTAVYSPGATISSSDSEHSLVPSGTPPAASAHIFEYTAASKLIFQDVQEITSPATDYRADFHFHTAPSDCTPHGRMMFNTLLQSALGLTTIQLSQPSPDQIPIIGSALPSDFDPAELTIPKPGDNPCPSSDKTKKAGQKLKMAAKPMLPPLRTTASCAGAGIGLGTS